MKKTDAKGPGPPRQAPAAERLRAFRTGLSAESRAAAFLIAKGYRILARRYRTPYGEIDIVARRRNLVAFVEVKARATLDDAAYAVTPRQRKQRDLDNFVQFLERIDQFLAAGQIEPDEGRQIDAATILALRDADRR